MGDLISRQVLDLWDRYKPTIAVDAMEYDRKLKQLLGTNLAEVGTDCISRQAAIDEMIKMLSYCFYADEEVLDAVETTLKELPSVQPTFDARDTQYNLPIGTDVISRQAAIDALEKCHKMCCREDACGDEWIHYETVLNEVECIPPAEPKRGRWIGKYPVTSVCSECGFLIHDSKVKAFAYCPNCGAKMEGVSNES